MSEKKKRYTKNQQDWCSNYELATTFEPMMDDFEAGNETFAEAARKNVLWFEGWASDALLRCDLNHLSIGVDHE